MDLVSASLNGLQFTSSGYDTEQPVDFAFSANGASVVAFANWWATAWGPGNGIEYYEEEFIEVPRREGEPETAILWRSDRDPELELRYPDSPEMYTRVTRARAATDSFREDYIVALRALKDALGDSPDISPWIAAIERRPIPSDDVLAAYRSPRDVGILVLERSGSDKQTVAVFDDNGMAAVAGPDSPVLKPYVNEWMGRPDDDRPPVADYISWASQRTFPGPYSIMSSRVERKDGFVDEIAAGLASRA